MSPYLSESSPLSSPDSSIETPPSARQQEIAQPSDKNDSPAVVALADRKSTPIPMSPVTGTWCYGDKYRKKNTPAPAATTLDTVTGAGTTTATNNIGMPSASPSSPTKSTSSSTSSKKRSLTNSANEQPTSSPKKKTKASPTPAPTGPTRPTRNRKAPERLISTPQAVKAKPALTPQTKLAPASKIFDPTYMTTNSKSRLTRFDIYHLLLVPTAWTTLTAAQKLSLLALLPPTPNNRRLAGEIEAGTAPPATRPIEFGANFNLFRTDVAKFKEELAGGQLGKGWQEDSARAVVERAEGHFDWWKAEESEMWWGQKGE
jgi:hypothetical protein